MENQVHPDLKPGLSAAIRTIRFSTRDTGSNKFRRRFDLAPIRFTYTLYHARASADGGGPLEALVRRTVAFAAGTAAAAAGWLWRTDLIPRFRPWGFRSREAPSAPRGDGTRETRAVHCGPAQGPQPLPRRAFESTIHQDR